MEQSHGRVHRMLWQRQERACSAGRFQKEARIASARGSVESEEPAAPVRKAAVADTAGPL